MRALLLLAVVLMVVPTASAQTRIQPINGGYGTTYVIYGRAIDATGAPVVYGTINASLEAPNVVATPSQFGTDCYGFFIGYFTINKVDPDGIIKVTLGGPAGSATDSHPLDPFFRRSDFKLTYPGTWQGAPCTDERQAPWDGRISVSGRILERTAPYVQNGVTLHAKAFESYIKVFFVDENGTRYCPPNGNAPNLCDPIAVDERGDFRYSWTFLDSPKPATGHIEIRTENGTFNFTLDPRNRIAFGEIEASGQGVFVERPSPTPGLSWALVAVGIAALGARRLLPRHPR